ncbi:MAG: hypothetical protein HRT67_06995 [Flavobacteriaceae bacterium]|nr:hypothetical protein [Flavobacteriaceae bacterium]
MNFKTNRCVIADEILADVFHLKRHLFGLMQIHSYSTTNDASKFSTS